MHHQNMLILVVLLLVTACGGGGGGTDASTPKSAENPESGTSAPAAPKSGASPDQSSVSYLALLDEFNQFVGNNGIEQKFKDNIALPRDIPTEGTARYTGATILSVGPCHGDSRPHLVGKTNLLANFKNAKFSGYVRSFSAVGTHTTKAGKLNLSGEIISNRLSGRISGNVSFDQKNHAIDGAINGYFLNGATDVLLTGVGKTKGGDNYSAVISGSGSLPTQ